MPYKLVQLGKKFAVKTIATGKTHGLTRVPLVPRASLSLSFCSRA